MLIRILLNPKLSFRERLKRVILYLKKRRGVKYNWKRKFKAIHKAVPEYKFSAEKDVEKSHRSIWRYFDSCVNFSTLRISKNISGVSDPWIIPEEVFAVDIEPSLNNVSEVGWFAFKSGYNHWFESNIFPADYLHNINGEWLDSDLKPIDFSSVIAISRDLNYPVVVKPNRDSYGGKGVLFPTSFESLRTVLEKASNFVVQEKIAQHPFFSKFHPASLNTVRVYVYRSVVDNRLHITNSVLRMGRGYGLCDNVTSGGIRVLITQDGYLSGYAVDALRRKYYTHPDTGVGFNESIPNWDELKKFTINVAHKILYSRLMGLDVCLDEKSNWRMIEINNFSATIGMSQNYGIPFFGEHLAEVYEYCKNNHWALI